MPTPEKIIMEGEGQQTIQQPDSAGKTYHEDEDEQRIIRSGKQDDKKPAETLQNWAVGDVILDTYEVKGELGKGGFGKVYRAHHRGWNMDLAVKRALNLGEANKQDFIDEAQHWIDLGLHPHIISCYYVRNIDGFPHTFAELAAGGSLHDWIREEQGTLYEGNEQEILARILDIAIQFAWGLGYAHQQGLLHGDVKPQNALMTPEGVLKVTDFGLARAGQQEGGVGAGEPTQHKIIYSPYHCSPEQRMGKPLTLATDIWSWGVSVLEMFNGGISWMGGQVAASALESYLQRAGDEDDIPSMPVAVAKLLRGCFQEDPQARPKNMLEIANRLLTVYQQDTGGPYFRENPKPADLRADSLNNKALTMLDLGKHQEAVEAWQDALKIDPHHAEGTYNYGMWRWLHGQQSDLEYVQQMNDVVKTLTKTWTPHYLLALIHAQRQDVPAVKQALGKVDDLRSFRDQQPANFLHLDTIPDAGCVKTFEGHTWSVDHAIITPDGNTLISGSLDKTLRVWDLKSGECLRSFRHTEGITALGITSDGKQIISASSDKTVRFWDLDSGSCLHVLKGELGGVRAFLLIANGHQIIASDDRYIRIWEINSGTCLQVLKGHDFFVSALAITDDEKTLVSGSKDATVRIWDLTTYECLNVLRGHTENIGVVAVTPDQRKIISGSEDQTVRVWERDSGKCLYTLKGHTNGVRTFAIYPDGKRLVSAGKVLRVWDIERGTSLQNLTGHTGIVRNLILKNDGDQVISCGTDHTVRVWRISNGQCLRTFEGHTHWVHQLVLTPDEKRVISCGGDNTLRLWQLPIKDKMKINWAVNKPRPTQSALDAGANIQKEITAAKAAIKIGKITQAGKSLRKALSVPGFERDAELLEMWHMMGQKAGRIQGLLDAQLRYVIKEKTQILVISPNGQLVATGCDTVIKIWEIVSGKCVLILEGHEDEVSALVFTSDGRQLISGGHDGAVRMWDLSSGRCQNIFKIKGGFVKKLIITPNQKQLLSARYKTIDVWDFNSGTCQFTLEGHTHTVQTFAVIPDGRIAVSGSQDRTLRVWDLSTGACLRTLFKDVGDLQTLAITPDGKRIILASDRKIRVRDMASGESRFNMEGHVGKIVDLVVTPDGKQVISCSHDETARTWDIINGQSLRILEGHTSLVENLVQIPDGHHFVSSSMDGTLRIWDLISGMCMRVIEGDAIRIRTLAITPNGRHLVSGGWDETLRVWTLDWDYEFPEFADWDEGARPYLETFLGLHTPFAGQLLSDRKPTEEEITVALTRQGKPRWTDEDFQGLMKELGKRGYGWLREEGVRKKLEEMAAERG